LSVQIKQDNLRGAKSKISKLTSAFEALTRAHRHFESSMRFFVLMSVIMHFVLILNVSVLLIYFWDDDQKRLTFTLIIAYGMSKSLLMSWSSDRVQKQAMSLIKNIYM